MRQWELCTGSRPSEYLMSFPKCLPYRFVPRSVIERHAQAHGPPAYHYAHLPDNVRPPGNCADRRHAVCRPAGRSERRHRRAGSRKAGRGNCHSVNVIEIERAQLWRQRDLSGSQLDATGPGISWLVRRRRFGDVDWACIMGVSCDRRNVRVAKVDVR